MASYLVTTELRTSLWIKVCRFFRFFKLKKNRKKFYITLDYEGYIKNDRLILDNSTCVLILKKK